VSGAAKVTHLSYELGRTEAGDGYDVGVGGTDESPAKAAFECLSSAVVHGGLP
jgi:hypothetical protein